MSLSEKIVKKDEPLPLDLVIPVADIKTFIKKLKEGNGIHSCKKGKCKCYNVDIEDENAIIILKEDLDSLLGDKLI